MSQHDGEQQLKKRVKKQHGAHVPTYADKEYKRQRKRMQVEALMRLRQAQDQFKGKPTRQTGLEEAEK